MADELVGVVAERTRLRGVGPHVEPPCFSVMAMPISRPDLALAGAERGS